MLHALHLVLLNETAKRGAVRLQLKCKAGVRRNAEHGSVMLMFTFHLGPLEVFCLAHLPRESEPDSQVYVKVRLLGRNLVDTDTSDVEPWVYDEEEDVVKLGDGDPEYVPLGPLLLTLEDGEVVVSLQKRTLIDPRFKSIEEWRVIK